MAFVENLAAFFRTSDFAVDATWNGTVQFVGIFDAAGTSALDVEGTDPRLTCAARDVVGMRRGDTVSIGGTAYKVKALEPDGTGLLTIPLEEQ